jgi:flagellar basal body rod protein FlgC
VSSSRECRPLEKALKPVRRVPIYVVTMNALSSIALSGMSAATHRMDVAAHNIANAATASFRRQQVVQQSQAGGGVSAQVTQAAVPGENLAADMVDQKVALYSFKANLRSLQVEHEMLGSLLDVRA